MTWEIAVGIIALAGFVTTVAAYAVKVTRVITSLESTLQILNRTLDEFRENNHASHKEIYGRLNDHESRIVRLEGRADIN